MTYRSNGTSMGRLHQPSPGPSSHPHGNSSSARNQHHHYGVPQHSATMKIRSNHVQQSRGPHHQRNSSAGSSQTSRTPPPGSSLTSSQQQQQQPQPQTQTTILLSTPPNTRPPSQVYTRGTTGAVVTRRYDGDDNVGTSPPQTPPRRSRSLSRSRPSHLGRHHNHQNNHNPGQHQNNNNNHTSSRRRSISRPRSNDDPHQQQHIRKSSSGSVHVWRNLETELAMVGKEDVGKPGLPRMARKTLDTSSETDNPASTSSRDEVLSPESTKEYVRTARYVVDDLSRAHNASERRIAAITNACEILDHPSEQKHNIELFHGAATALVKLLYSGQNDDEDRMILAAIEMVFRGSPKSVHAAYTKLGSLHNTARHSMSSANPAADSSSSAFLHTLLRLLKRFETQNVPHAEISILNISRILHSLSRSSELRSVLCRQPNFVSSVTSVSISGLSSDARLVRVRILGNLCHDSSQRTWLCSQDGLLDALLRIGHFCPDAITRQYAGNALCELSSESDLQVCLAQNETVLGTLVKLVLTETLATTRESAISALQNLAFTKENRTLLVDFKKGIVLEALKKALSGDSDPKARRRAAGALTNLACDETGQRMGAHKGLLNALAIVATKDDNTDVQTRASLALTKIANSITVEMASFDTLLDALVVASLSKSSNSVSGVLRVKARLPENRQDLARHSGVIDTLSDLVVSNAAETHDKDNSIRALYHLVNETGNRQILCNKTVLAAMVTAANYKDANLTEARDSAIRSLERLATEVGNRYTMAHTEGVVLCVAKAVERERVWELQGRQTEHGFLAKPLLMSLLVAM